MTLLGGSHSAYAGPRCAAHSANCARSSDGYWIPAWYYTSLSDAQQVTDPSTAGRQPSITQEEENGATPAEASEAQSASGASDGGGDPASAGSDENGNGSAGAGDEGGGSDEGGGGGGEGE